VVVERRRYLDCAECRLVHLAPEHRLTSDAERAHYATHRNTPTDPRYREFLDRLAIPLVAELAPGAAGLDYGSGPGPTLSVMLEERGYSVALYDPFFAPDRAALDRKYDFVTCTEAAEHFRRPLEEFERLASLLGNGGVLGLMTEVLKDGQGLEGWWYLRDPTHVSFYRMDTLSWVARRFGWSMRSVHRNVVLFRAAP
jgi:2-polyprenyl-3-methyl-5-hydroxy-6-metoxy-1,4-benzoquinol methylase